MSSHSDQGHLFFALFDCFDGWLDILFWQSLARWQHAAMKVTRKTFLPRSTSSVLRILYKEPSSSHEFVHSSLPSSATSIPFSKHQTNLQAPFLPSSSSAYVKMLVTTIAATILSLGSVVSALDYRGYSSTNGCSGSSFGCSDGGAVCCGPLPAAYGYSAQFDNLPAGVREDQHDQRVLVNRC